MRIDDAIAFHAKQLREPVPVPTAEYHRRFMQVVRDYDIRVKWFREGWRFNLARPKRREVEINEFVDEKSVASAFHEAGHVVAPPHAGGLHFNGRGSGLFSLSCWECERQAWIHAIQLMKPLAWSERMHLHMNYCLTGYRRYTTGLPEAGRQLDALKAPILWFHWQQQALEKTLPNNIDCLSARLAQVMK
jgi:hypothetical protein